MNKNLKYVCLCIDNLEKAQQQIIQIIMKLNFIKNLSDELVKQNHDLKANILKSTQKLKDYETQIFEGLCQIKELVIEDSPQNTLKRFIRDVKVLHEDFTSTKEQLKKFKNEFRTLKENYDKMLNILSQKEILIKQLIESQQKCRKDANHFEAKLKEENQILMKQNKIIAEQIKELQNQKKLDILKQEVKTRTQIQQMRLYYKDQFTAYQEKIEKQNYKIEYQMKQQLKAKEKTIKSLGKTLEKIGKNIEISEKDGEEIKKIFEYFQDHSLLNETIQFLRQQNLELKQIFQDTKRQNQNLSSKNIELRANQYNLLCKIERIEIEKNQLSKDLIQKIKEIDKSEKDKIALDLYYEEKWNSQYRKMKSKHQNIIKNRIKQLENQFQNRKISAEQQILNLQSQKQQLLLKIKSINNALQILSQQNQNQKNKNQKQQLKLNEICQRFYQVQKMMLQDQYSKKNQKQSIISILNHKINSLQNRIQELNYQILQNNLAHNNHIYQLQKITKKRFKQQEEIHQLEINKIHQQFQFKKKNIFNIIQEKERLIRQYQIDMNIKYEQKLKENDKKFILMLQEKEKEAEKKNQKYIQIHREMQEQLLKIKKQAQKKQKQYENGKLKFQARIAELLQNERSSNQMYQKLSQQKQKSIKNYQRFIQKYEILEKQMAYNIDMHRITEKQLFSAKEEIELLFNRRKTWEKEITNLSKQFFDQFKSLKQIHSKQISLLKGKINELQNYYKKNFVSKKDLQKIKILNLQKVKLEDQVHNKEAQNIILNQVKDYYQCRLKETDRQFLINNEFRSSHMVISRKNRKNHYTNTVKDLTQRVFQSKQIQQMKRYIQVNKRQNNKHSSKSQFAEFNRHLRVNSSMV